MKIVDNTAERLALKIKEEAAEKLLRGFIIEGDRLSLSGLELKSFSHGSILEIDCALDKVTVYLQDYFEMAKTIARQYKEQILTDGGEVTLEKDYSEREFLNRLVNRWKDLREKNGD